VEEAIPTSADASMTLSIAVAALGSGPLDRSSATAMSRNTGQARC